MNSEGFFNINEFKKWMEEDQNDSPKKSKFIGLQVESKASIKKLTNKMESDEDVSDLAEDFVENGGIVTNVDGHWFTVEVDSGSFMIPRNYVRRS